MMFLVALLIYLKYREKSQKRYLIVLEINLQISNFYNRNRIRITPNTEL